MSTSSACVEKRSGSAPSSKQPGASSGTVMLVAFPGQTPDPPSASHRCSHDNQGITVSVPDGLAFRMWEIAPISDYGFALVGELPHETASAFPTGLSESDLATIEKAQAPWRRRTASSARNSSGSRLPGDLCQQLRDLIAS
jgi:hypothetical protein